MRSHDMWPGKLVLGVGLDITAGLVSIPAGGDAMSDVNDLDE